MLQLKNNELIPVCHNHIRFYWPKDNMCWSNGYSLLVVLAEMVLIFICALLNDKL